MVLHNDNTFATFGVAASVMKPQNMRIDTFKRRETCKKNLIVSISQLLSIRKQSLSLKIVTMSRKEKKYSGEEVARMFEELEDGFDENFLVSVS